MITKNFHREGKIQLFDVIDGEVSYRIAYSVDSSSGTDGIKIPLINGVEQKSDSRLIGAEQIRHLLTLMRED